MSNGDSTRSEREALLGGSNTPRKPAGRRGRKLALGGGALLLIAVALLVAAPGIGARLAPGIIQSSLSKQFQGRMKVSGASLSWGGPQTLGPIEIADPSGKPIGQITVKAGVGLLGLFGSNLGITTVSGNFDLVRNADGTTNLQQALAPVAIKLSSGSAPGAAAPAAAQGAVLPIGYRAAITLDPLDVKYTELDAAGKPGRETSIKGLKGTASISTVAPGAVAIDMAAAVIDAGKPGGSIKVSVKADNFCDAKGNLTRQAAKVHADIDLASLPTALLDALAGQNGLLASALGATVSTNLRVGGTASAGTANVVLDTPNVSATMALTFDGGTARLAKPGQFTVRSTQFAAALPAVREALAKAGMGINQWPGVEGTIDALVLPVPKAQIAEADYRGAAIGLTIGTSAIAGTLVVPGDAGSGASAPTAFSVAPLKATLAAADLAKGLDLKAATNATLGGQSAGAINIALSAAGLLDDKGRILALRGESGGGGGLPGNINANVSAQGVSMALVQPVVAGLGLPIDLNADVGPTLDAKAVVQTTEGGATKLDATLESRNVKVAAPLLLKGGVLTTSGGPITLSVQSAAGLASRVLTAAPGAGTTTQPFITRVGGAGTIEASIADLSLTLSAKDAKTGAPRPMDLSTAAAVVKAHIGNLAVWMGTAADPVKLDDVALDLSAKPGVAPIVNIKGKMAHGTRPFDLAGTLQVAGLDSALGNGSAKPGAMMPGVQTVRISGQVLLSNVPTSLVALVQPASATELARGVLGDTVNASILFDQPQKGSTPPADPARQLVDATLTGTGLNASLSADLNAAELRLRGLNAEATLRPETFTALAHMASAPPAGAAPGAPRATNNLANIRVSGPAKVLISAEPVSIPIKVVGNSVQPQFASAGTLNTKVSIPGTFAVGNVPMGDKMLAGGVRDFSLVAGVPLAMFAPQAASGGGAASTQKLTAAGKGSLMLDERTGVAELDLKATAAADLSTVDASVNITQVNTAALDNVLGQPGMASGTLGESAAVAVTALRSGGANKPLTIAANITSQRLKTGPLEFVSDPSRIALAKPTSVQWTIDPAWAERYLLSGKDKDGKPIPATMRFASPVSLSANLRALAVAVSESRGGLAVSGPLKPGVFALDADLTLPRVDLLLVQPSGPPRPATLNQVKAAIKAAPDASVAFDASVASVDAGEVKGAGGTPVTAKGSISKLAYDNGVLEPRNAVVGLNVQAAKFPTAVVDALAGRNGQLVQTLGGEVDLNIKAVDASYNGGSVDVRMDSRRAGVGNAPGREQARFSVGGPIKDAVLDVGAGGGKLPLNLALVSFKYESKASIMKALPLFASVSKNEATASPAPAASTADSKPVSITSGNLRAPIDGRMENFNGDIVVDLGLIQYTFKEALGEFLDQTVFSAGQEPQKPILPFTIAVRNGVATYDKFDIPIRQFVLSTRGTVDLVRNEVDVVTYIPTIAASKGLLSRLSGEASSGLGKAVPDLLTEGTMIPIRAKGPMDNPRIYPDFELFFKEFGKNLQKQPEKILNNVIDLFGKKKAK